MINTALIALALVAGQHGGGYDLGFEPRVGCVGPAWPTAPIAIVLDPTWSATRIANIQAAADWWNGQLDTNMLYTVMSYELPVWQEFYMSGEGVDAGEHGHVQFDVDFANCRIVGAMISPPADAEGFGAMAHFLGHALNLAEDSIPYSVMTMSFTQDYRLSSGLTKVTNADCDRVINACVM